MVAFSLRPYSVPLRSPFSAAWGTVTRRNGVLLVADDDLGLGDAAPLTGWTEAPTATRVALQEARTAIDRGGWRGALERTENAPAARHALALLRADRAARRADRSLAHHLAEDTTPGSIPVNATVGDADVSTTVERARALAGGGFDCLKVKVGSRTVDTDVTRVRTIRDRLGDDLTLRLDANGAWSIDTAERAMERLAPLDIQLIEQPVAPDRIDDLAALSGGEIPVAVDESLRRNAPGLQAVLDAGAADAVVVKPMVVGGPDRTLAMVGRAETNGLDWVITTTVDAVVARTAAVHLAAALDPDLACGLATADRLRTDLATDPTTVRDGAITVPDGPGIGVTLEADPA